MSCAEYNKAQNLTMRASALSQKIIDARLDLIRLRQTHPHPRLTIPLADQRLVDQVAEMQTLNDELEEAQRQMHKVKERIRAGTSEAERLRMERAETEYAVRKIKDRAAADAQNERLLVSLYDWYVLTPSITKLSVNRAFVGTRLHWRSTALSTASSPLRASPITSSGSNIALTRLPRSISPSD